MVYQLQSIIHCRRFIIFFPDLIVWWKRSISRLYERKNSLHGWFVLFAVTVYKDAKMRCKKYVVLWSVLVGVLGPLCGVVYWIVRKTVYAEKIVCADCGHVQHVVQHGDNQRTVSVLFIVSCIVLATVLLLHNFFYGTFCMLSDGSNIPAWIWSFP